MFNGAYSNDVAGMVLVDASSEDLTNKMPPALQEEMNKMEVSLRRQNRFAPALVYLGIGRLLDDTSGLTFLSPDDRREALYLELQTKFYAAELSEVESFSVSENEVRGSGNLGAKPLIVLTGGNWSETPPGWAKKDWDDLRTLWLNDLQVREVHLSTRGKQIIVADSDHMIPFERPDTIVSAIHDVWLAANAANPGGEPKHQGDAEPSMPLSSPKGPKTTLF